MRDRDFFSDSARECYSIYVLIGHFWDQKGHLCKGAGASFACKALSICVTRVNMFGIVDSQEMWVRGVINPPSSSLHMGEERTFCWGAWGRQEAALSACPCDRFRGVLSRMETSGGQSLCEAVNKTALYKNRPNGNHRWQKRAVSIWKWAHCSQPIYLMGSCSQMGGDF